MKIKCFLLTICVVVGLVGCGSNEEKTLITQGSVEEERIQEGGIQDERIQEGGIQDERIQDESITPEENVDEIEGEEFIEEDFNLEDVGKTFVSGDYEYTVLNDGTVELSSYSGTNAILVLPDNIDGYTISEIGRGSIISDDLVELTIPGTVKVVCEQSIFGKNIQTIILEEGVEVIEKDAFLTIENLINVSFPTSLKYVGMDMMKCFDTTGGLEYYEGLYYIDNIVCGFDRNKENWDEIRFKEGTRGIAGRAFCNTNGGARGDGTTMPSEIIIPDGVEFIGEEAFLGRSEVEKIHVPESVNTIGNAAIGYIYINYEYRNINAGKIYGYEGSGAEQYAYENGLEFVTLR